MRPADAKELIDKLSKSQREVCRRIVLGQESAVIAERMGIGIRSVETFRWRARRKLKVASHGIARIWYCALCYKEPDHA